MISSVKQEIHTHKTRDALNNLTDIPQSRKFFYGRHSIRSKAVIAWNTMQNELGFNLNIMTLKR